MNSLIYTVYFLLVGALLALLHAGTLKTTLHGVTTRRAATVLVIATLGVTAVLTAPQLRRLPETVQDFPHDVVSSAFRFVKEHPGEVYLPYHPLVTLMAEDQAYHLLLETQSRQYFDYLVGGSDLDASDADERSFFAFIPPDLNYVLYRTDGGTPMTGIRRPYSFQDHLWRYLPDMTHEVPVAPGWTALVDGRAQLTAP